MHYVKYQLQSLPKQQGRMYWLKTSQIINSITTLTKLYIELAKHIYLSHFIYQLLLINIRNVLENDQSQSPARWQNYLVWIKSLFRQGMDTTLIQISVSYCALYRFGQTKDENIVNSIEKAQIYLDNNILSECHKIDECKPNKMFIKWKYTNSDPLKDIIEVNFSQLFVLNLLECRIETIQSLSRIRIPYLRVLQLRKNCINNIRMMTKMNTQVLTVFDVTQNRISTFMPFFEAKMIFIGQILFLEQKQKIKSLSLNDLAKFVNIRAVEIVIEMDRIKQKIVMKKMRQKNIRVRSKPR